MEMPELEERGYFWWSDDKLEDDQFASPNGCAGVLTITRAGVISLDLDGVLPDERGRFAVLDRNREPLVRTISGIVRKTKRHVILSGLMKNGGSVSTNSLSYEKFSALHCLVSYYRLTRDATTPLFKKMTIPLDGYEEWAGRGDIEVKREEDSTVLSYNQTENHIYRVHDKAVRLRFGVDGPEPGRWFREVAYKEYVMLDFKFMTPVGVERIIKEHNSFQDMLVLFTNSEKDIEWPLVFENISRDEATLYFRRAKREVGPVRDLDC